MQALLEQLNNLQPPDSSQTRWRIPKRIAMFGNVCLPYSTCFTAQRTHSIALALTNLGYEVYVFSQLGFPWDCHNADSLSCVPYQCLEGVHYVYPKRSLPATASLNQLDFDEFEFIAELLRVFKPSLVLASSSNPQVLSTLLASKLAQLPFIYEVRNLIESGFSKPRELANPSDQYPVDLTLFKQADRLIVISAEVAGVLGNLGAEPEKILLLPQSINTLPKLQPRNIELSKRYKLDQAFVVGCFGALEEAAGLGELLEAASLLKRQGFNLIVLIVSAPTPFGMAHPYRATLSTLAKQLNFEDRLVLVDTAEPEQIGAFYTFCHVVVTPEWLGGNVFPTLIQEPLEALAYGRPWLGAETPANLELQAEAGVGRLFNQQTTSSLASNLRRLLEDREERDSFGKAARKWVQENRLYSQTITPLAQAIETLLALHSQSTQPQVLKTAVDPAEVPLPPYPNRGAGYLRVAAIMDEFTQHSYAAECNLLPLHTAAWNAQLEEFQPELLFIESAWRGLGGLWDRKVATASQELLGAINWCKARGIPTVFWNKEDPIHFETFLTTANLFDLVFTTDIDCIHRYKAALNHDRVYLLPFACQPQLQNPIETYERKDAFCFAGAYYTKYPDRTKDLGNFVAELPKFRPLEIYDRNYGKDDPNYQFPPEYQPYIVGTLPFDQIDKAYKGYRYSINLNSIKQSQTMFARRVFELLSCNTITVSNFSRGVRLMFGDLVITTDDGTQMVQRLQQLAGDAESSDKLRLAGLRKVLSQHTYTHRFAYVTSKAFSLPYSVKLPTVTVLAIATDLLQLQALYGHWQRQSYRPSSMKVFVNTDTYRNWSPQDPTFQVLEKSTLKNQTMRDLLGNEGFVTGFMAEDYYGPNYLYDLLLTTQYSDAELIGKAAYFEASGNEIQLINPEAAYQPKSSLDARCSLVLIQVVADQAVLSWLENLDQFVYQEMAGQAVDPYNYCRCVSSTDLERVSAKVNDAELYPGLELAVIQAKAESIQASENATQEDAISWDASFLSSIFGTLNRDAISFEVKEGEWHIASSLADGKHDYLYATQLITPEDIAQEGQIRCYLDIAPGLNLQLVLLFLDSEKQRLSHVIFPPNRNQTAQIPEQTRFIRLGWRVYGAGKTRLKRLLLGHLDVQTSLVLAQAKHLLLTNQYPTYDDIYRYGFVHTRTKAYQNQSLRVDIFRLRKDEPISYHEFENMDVVSAAPEMLYKMLASGDYQSVLVHFLDSTLWEIVQPHLERIKLIVWIHGAEIQPWHRRAFNYSTEAEILKAMEDSDKRMAFWRDLLASPPSNAHFVFVSNYLAETVMEDLDIQLPPEKYEIIHNPINTELYSYQPKPPEQRAKILSIRPYASPTYANDLAVKAILELADQPWFEQLEVRLIGDGPLFKSTLEPLQHLSNVSMEQRFVSQGEIASLHKSYGLFLCPSRMDTQGVSRDEAMSSGLVPITSAVAAVPEFVDKNCGILAPAEDAHALAEGITKIYFSPEEFLKLSKNAASRVRQQSSSSQMLAKEISLINRVVKNS